MERGLLWLPLLGLFSWLAWAGWNEYQKVEAYKQWASQFERAKYDIYAVLGQRNDELVWGIPTRSTPVNVQSIQLGDIAQVQLTVNGEPIDVFGVSDPKPVELKEAQPKEAQRKGSKRKGKVALQFILSEGQQHSVPFTDQAIAERWYRFLAPRVISQ